MVQTGKRLTDEKFLSVINKKQITKKRKPKKKNQKKKVSATLLDEDYDSDNVLKICAQSRLFEKTSGKTKFHTKMKELRRKLRERIEPSTEE